MEAALPILCQPSLMPICAHASDMPRASSSSSNPQPVPLCSRPCPTKWCGKVQAVFGEGVWAPHVSGVRTLVDWKWPTVWGLPHFMTATRPRGVAYNRHTAGVGHMARTRSRGEGDGVKGTEGPNCEPPPVCRPETIGMSPSQSHEARTWGDHSMPDKGGGGGAWRRRAGGRGASGVAEGTHWPDRWGEETI